MHVREPTFPDVPSTVPLRQPGACALRNSAKLLILPLKWCGDANLHLRCVRWYVLGHNDFRNSR